MSPTPLRILVVEDDHDLLDLASRILVAAGHEVVTASAAEEAKDRLDGVDIDLLFTDIVLPGASGLELAADVTTDRPDLPVLFTTGQVEPERHDEIRATGHPLLLKPYTADSLREALSLAREGGAGGTGDRP